jgi:alkylation response protein AidB-like acyl-CoA dehydrogenase
MRQRIAAIHSDIACMRLMTDGVLQQRGVLAAPASGSLIKLAWSRCSQALGNLAVDGTGSNGTSDGWTQGLLQSRQCSIAGGTTEINLNIASEQILGLPREPR